MLWQMPPPRIPAQRLPNPSLYCVFTQKNKRPRSDPGPFCFALAIFSLFRALLSIVHVPERLQYRANQVKKFGDHIDHRATIRTGLPLILFFIVHVFQCNWSLTD